MKLTSAWETPIFPSVLAQRFCSAKTVLIKSGFRVGDETHNVWLSIMKPTAKRSTSLIAVLVSMIVCTVAWSSPLPSQTDHPGIVAGGSTTTVMPHVASSQTNNPVIVTGGSTKVVIPPSEQYPTDRAFIEAIQKLIPANGEPLTWRLEPENISVTEKQWQAYLADNLRKAKAAADYRKKAGIQAPKKIDSPIRANDKV